MYILLAVGYSSLDSGHLERAGHLLTYVPAALCSGTRLKNLTKHLQTLSRPLLQPAPFVPGTCCCKGKGILSIR
jgi:hypothetical protein